MKSLTTLLIKYNCSQDKDCGVRLGQYFCNKYVKGQWPELFYCKEYSGRNVHCCFNIYKRPENGLNGKPNYKTEVIEVREVIKNQNPKRNRELGDFQYDIAICAWGAIGKECSVGQYAKTFYIKIKDTNHFEYYKSLILSADWCKMYKMTGTPNLLQWQLYKYVKENELKGE